MSQRLLHLTNGYQSGEEPCPLAGEWKVTRHPLPVPDSRLTLAGSSPFQLIWLPFTLNGLSRQVLPDFVNQLAARLERGGSVLAMMSDAALGGLQLAYGLSGMIEQTDPPRSSDQLLCGMEGEYLTHMLPDQWGRLFLKQGYRRVNVERRQGKILVRAYWKLPNTDPLDEKIRITDGFDGSLFALPGQNERLEGPPKPWRLDGVEQK